MLKEIAIFSIHSKFVFDLNLRITRAGSAVEALRRMIKSNDCFATMNDL